MKAAKVVAPPDKMGSRMKTIPNSNLDKRKRDVLDIHRENLRIVKRLADMKVQ